MGLDITAISQIKYIDSDEDRDYEKSRYLGTKGCDFPERTDGLAEGNYSYASAYHFHAGPYSRYNCWREWLSELMFQRAPKDIWENFERYGGQPFVELIYFTDCDGVIGPKTAGKLLKDFLEYEHLLERFPQTSDPYGYCNQYRSFITALRLAADNGALIFG